MSSPDPTQSRTLTGTDTTKVHTKPYPQFSVASPMVSILLFSGLLVQLTVCFTECTQYLSPIIAGRKLTKPHPRHPYRHHGPCTLKTPFLAYFLLETKQQSDHCSDRWLLILTPPSSPWGEQSCSVSTRSPKPSLHESPVSRSRGFIGRLQFTNTQAVSVSELRCLGNKTIVLTQDPRFC